MARYNTLKPQSETMYVKRGSSVHKSLIQRVESAQRAGWTPRWYFNGICMDITNMKSLDDKGFIVNLTPSKEREPS